MVGRWSTANHLSVISTTDEFPQNTILLGVLIPQNRNQSPSLSAYGGAARFLK